MKPSGRWPRPFESSSAQADQNAIRKRTPAENNHHPPVIAKRQQAFEQFARFSAAAEQDKVVRIPKAAGEEGAFSTPKAIACSPSVVAKHQAIA